MKHFGTTSIGNPDDLMQLKVQKRFLSNRMCNYTAVARPPSFIEDETQQLTKRLLG